MIQSYNDFLTHNKQWLDALSASIAFISGMFGIFFKSTVKEDEDGKKHLTGWGLFTLMTLVASTFIQFSLKQANAIESKQKDREAMMDQYKRDSLLKVNFATQLMNLDKVSNNISQAQKSNDSNFELDDRKLNSNLNDLQKMNTGLNTLYQKSTNSFDRIISNDTSIQHEQFKTLQSIETSTEDLRKATMLANYPLAPVQFDVTFAIDISLPVFASYLKELKKIALGRDITDLKSTEFFDRKILAKYGGFINNFRYIATFSDTVGFARSFDFKNIVPDSDQIIYYGYSQEVNYRIRKFGDSYYIVQELNITATIPHILSKRINSAKDLKGYTFFFVRHYHSTIPDKDFPGYWKPISIIFDKQAPYTIPFEPKFSLKQIGLNAADFYITCEKWDENGERRAINLEDRDFKEKAVNP